MKYIEHVLEFELIKIANFSLSVYNLFIVVFIFFAVKGANHSIDLLIKKRLERDGVNDFVEGRSKSLTQIFKYIIYILGFAIAINSLGIDMNFIIGVFAALGLGIGFALQDVFKDLISGIIILFEGNVSVGDILEVDGIIGTVKEIKLRTSLVRTRDGIYIVVPNNRIVNEKVINWSTNTKITRFSVAVGVAYGSDVEKVKKLLLQSVADNEIVSKRPTSTVFFKDFGDSALQFELHYWILDTWKTEIVKSDLRFAIDKLFRENDIQIPFPQRDVHLIQQ
ncbi:MAG: mechanosensitive ion channel protein MscS [Flavobacteriales bacterium]|nr:MAG: mechanosensitive ion channel protein MscS [Flavobacteriales bacterium]